MNEIRKKKRAEWEEVRRELIPESTTVHPAEHRSHFTYATMKARVWERKTVAGETTFRCREESTEAVYAHEHIDLTLAFTVAAEALKLLEAACTEADAAKQQKLSRRRKSA